MTAGTAATDLRSALAAGPVVLDGGLATTLEDAGHDLSDALWSARLLRDDPEAVVAAHAAHAAAGAAVLTSASYQASRQGLAAAGVGPREADRLLAGSVGLARRGLGDWPGWVAASVGPYGAVLADGSEYRGDYGLDVGALRRWHRSRLEVLAAAGADVLACETVPCLAEAEALLAEVAALGTPAWLSLTVVVDDAGVVRTRAGEPAAEAFAMAADVAGVVAVGVNCCHPADVLPALAAVAGSGVPAVAYPNRGERWDAVARGWRADRGTSDGGPAAPVAGWVDAGARLVGGCCRVGPDVVTGIAAAVGSTGPTAGRAGQEPVTRP